MKPSVFPLALLPFVSALNLGPLPPLLQRSTTRSAAALPEWLPHAAVAATASLSLLVGEPAFAAADLATKSASEFTKVEGLSLIHI